MSRAKVSTALLLALMITGVASATAEASFPRDWIYPIDRAPCDSAHTLQQCVQGAASGDTVEIHTNTPLHQGVEIAKRLSLMSSPGYHATLDNLMIDPGSGTIQVHVSRLAVGSVLVELNGGSNHVIDLERLTVSSLGSTAVELDSSVPADITLSGSSVHVPTNFQTIAVGAESLNSTGLVHFRIDGNVIDQHPSTSASAGLALVANGSGQSTFDLYNNSIWDTDQCFCELLGAVDINDLSSGASLFNVVGNTIEKSGGYGLDIHGDSSGAVDVEDWNNIFSHTAHAAVHIARSAPSPLVFHGGSNDYYSNVGTNTLGGHSLGKGNLTANPSYTDAPHGVLHLSSSSTLVNKGIVCSGGGIAITDAAGNNRLKGSSVDLGAFERGAGAVTGVAIVGSPAGDEIYGSVGADIICGLGGTDVLRGEGGDDYVDGGPGNDEIEGGPGADELFGSLDNDVLCGADGTNGNDVINGGPGTDKYSADPSDQVVAAETTGASCP